MSKFVNVQFSYFGRVGPTGTKRGYSKTLQTTNAKPMFMLWNIYV